MDVTPLVHTSGINWESWAAIVTVVSFVVGFFAYLLRVVLFRRLDNQDSEIVNIKSDAKTAADKAADTNDRVARIEGYLAGITRPGASQLPDIKEAE
jgi:hypothetical protein